MVVLAVGRKQLFNYVACRFDRDPVHAVQEGAFIVELLTGAALAEGQAWRVHREIVQKNETYPETDHRHHWRLGCIVEINEGVSFVANLSEERRPSRIPQ